MNCFFDIDGDVSIANAVAFSQRHREGNHHRTAKLSARPRLDSVICVDDLSRAADVRPTLDGDPFWK
jgi:hypothetical protein